MGIETPKKIEPLQPVDKAPRSAETLAIENSDDEQS